MLVASEWARARAALSAASMVVGMHPDQVTLVFRTVGALGHLSFAPSELWETCLSHRWSSGTLVFHRLWFCGFTAFPCVFIFNLQRMAGSVCQQLGRAALHQNSGRALSQAAGAIVAFAVSHGLPFAVVPCCVYRAEFPKRRLR